MNQTHDEIRAVRVMVDELRDQAPPAIRWDDMEKRLLARLAERDAVILLRRPAQPPSALGRVFGFAVAAAVLAFGVASTTSGGRMPAVHAVAPHAVDVATVALAPNATSGAHDLAALRPGDHIEAGDASVSFAKAGLVTWTLAPGSALRVRSVGLGHTVELERGSLRAEVTPRDPSEGLVEAFAVEVDGTRVAVHGTAFSVQRTDGHVVVDVEHGAVAVGPIGNAGATTGHLLVGPARASFSLDGGRDARRMDRPVAVASNDAPSAVAAVAVGLASPSDDLPRADDPAPVKQPLDGASSVSRPLVGTVVGALVAHASVDAKGKAAPEAPAPGVAAPEAARLTVATVRGRLDRCFRQVYEAAPSTLEVSSTLTIDVAPDGSVRAARFSPPLKPELTDCAGRAISGRFADDAGHVEVPVSFKP